MTFQFSGRGSLGFGFEIAGLLVFFARAERAEVALTIKRFRTESPKNLVRRSYLVFGYCGL